MKFGIKNLGPVEEANIELGDLTIICGKNNTGKTYITYAIYDFFKFFRDYINLNVTLDWDKQSDTIRFDLNDFVKEANNALKKATEKYSLELFKNKNTFSIDKVLYDFDFKFGKNWKMRDAHFAVEKNKTIITIQKKSQVINPSKTDNAPTVSEFAKAFIELCFFGKTFQNKTFGNCVSITSERTGLSIFRRTLNKGNLRQINNAEDAPVSQEEDLRTTYSFSIQDNFEYIISLEDISKHRSIILNRNDIINFLEDITMGRYEFMPNDIIYFTPNGTEAKLTMDKCSSSVRALLLLDSYIRHSARPGDLLMIDEPEMNLHPENQRNLARLLALLVNAGIRVFITTHSDYIVREFDFMTRLHGNRKLAEKLGYTKNHLLEYNRIKKYISQKIENSNQCNLQEIEVSPEIGITESAFDDSIEKMNFIQRAIQFGDISSDEEFTFVEPQGTDE